MSTAALSSSSGASMVQDSARPTASLPARSPRDTRRRGWNPPPHHRDSGCARIEPSQVSSVRNPDGFRVACRFPRPKEQGRIRVKRGALCSFHGHRATVLFAPSTVIGTVSNPVCFLDAILYYSSSSTPSASVYGVEPAPTHPPRQERVPGSDRSAQRLRRRAVRCTACVRRLCRGYQ
jgi:hypothetical protein